MRNLNSARQSNPTKDKHAIQLILDSPRAIVYDHAAQTQVERTHQWAARAAAEHRVRTNLVPTPSLIRYREAFHPAPNLTKSSLTFWARKLWQLA